MGTLTGAVPGQVVHSVVAGTLVATEVTYSASNWGAGSTTELVASTPADYYLTSFDVACGGINSNSTAVTLSVWAGEGNLGGSWWESVVLLASCCMSVKTMTGAGTARIGRDLSIPIHIPAGTRLAMSVDGGLGDFPTGWMLYARLTPVR